MTAMAQSHALDSPLATPAGCPIGSEQKQCNTCGKTCTATTKHFARNGAVCLVCHRNNRTRRKEKAALRRKKALDKIEISGVDLYTELATAGGGNIPHSAELLERILQYFGGVAGFSAILVKQYYDAAPGGSARNRLLETIVRLVTKNVEAGGAKKPLTMWSEEELEAELDQRFAQALSTYRGVTVNGEAQVLPAPITEECAGDPHTEDTEPDGVPEGRDQESPGGTAGEAAGSLEAVQANPTAAGDARVHGPGSAGDRR